MAALTPYQARYGAAGKRPAAKNTRCEVTFYSWTKELVGSTADAQVRKRLGHPHSFHTSKQFGEASGSFVIQMHKPETLTTREFLKLWREPEAVWVLVEWFCDGVRIEGMLGIVDAMQGPTTRRLGYGRREESYTLHGRDVGKPFEESKVYINPYHPDLAMGELVAIYDTAKAAIEPTHPAGLVRNIVDTWIGNAERSLQAWELPPNLGSKRSSFYNLLSFDGVQAMQAETHGVCTNLSILNAAKSGGTLWSTMQEYCNPVLNEMWVDLAPRVNDPYGLRNLRPTLFLRERPFPSRLDPSRAWNAVTRWHLDREDVREMDLACGGAASRYNYWMLNPGGLGMSVANSLLVASSPGEARGLPGSLPVFNRKSIRRYGLRTWEQQTLFVPALGDTQGPSDPALKATGSPTTAWVALVAGWLHKLHDWYAPAPLQLSGRVTCSRAFPEIRIGHRVDIETEDGVIQAYVEGVETSGTYPGESVTALTVTRGAYEDEDLLEQAYADYETPSLLDQAEGALP